jgi:uncharacterized protein YlxW (UPF0749 family)
MAAEEKPRRTSKGAAARPVRNPPPQAVMGLLDYITATSLDGDYAQASERRTARGGKKNVRPGMAGLLILGIFGALLAVAAVQTSRDAPDAASSKQYLVKRVNEGKAQLIEGRNRIAALQKDVNGQQQLFLSASGTGRALQTKLGKLDALTGAEAVTGPGVRIVVNDAPNPESSKQQVLDEDLQKLVNGLWLVGAEAISINGQRLTNLSAIRHAGDAITVDYRSLTAPYTISAIGNPNQLAVKFIDTAGGKWWLDLHAVYGLPFSINSEESLTLPAASRLDLRYAKTKNAAR